MQYCEDVKQRSDSLQYALYIWNQPALAEHTARVKFYALQIFDYRIQKGSQTEKDELKQAFPQIVRHFPSVAATNVADRQEQKFLLEKFAAVLAELAMHEWPQKWPTLFDELLRAAGSASENLGKRGCLGIQTTGAQADSAMETNQARIICLLIERLSEETTR